MSVIPIRVIAATPSKDGEKVTIKAARHNDDWYVDLYGQNPNPFYRNPFLSPSNRIPYPLQATGSSYKVDDAMFPGANTIALYTGPGQITVASYLPINVFSALTSAPQVPRQASVGSGGVIPAGTWLVALVAVDSNGRKSKPSSFVAAVVASGSSTITVSGIVWDAGAVSGEVYLGADSLHMTRVAFAAATSSVTFGSVLTLNVAGLPDVSVNSVRILFTPIRHGGIWGSVASAIAGAYPSTPSSVTIASAPTLNQWAGRILSLYGSATPVPNTGALTFAGLCYAVPANFNVTGNSISGVMDISQDTWGGIGHVPFTYPGDAYVMRAMANIASANTIGDAAFVNQFAPTGLGVNLELGKVVWIMAGTGAGQRRSIASNTADTLTVTEDWDVIPDATSVFSVLESAPSLTIEGSVFSNDGINGSIAVLAVADSLAFTSDGSQSFLVQVVTEDAKGNVSPLAYAPWQEVFVPQQNTGTGVQTAATRRQ